MKLLFLFFLFSDTLHLNYQQAEARFLSQNLGLIAEKMKISEAKARKEQAKLWPNPSFTLDQINVYHPRGQQAVPPLWGNFGANRQFAMELEQWIRTAGKRKKEQALLQVAVNLEEISFAEVLWEAKRQLRRQLSEAEYLEEEKALWTGRLHETRDLYVRLSQQVEAGNLPKSEQIRLQAYVLALEQEVNTLHYALTETQGNLRKWLNTDAHLRIQEPLHFAVLDTSSYGRPDLKHAQEIQSFHTENLHFQKAQKVPDVQLKIQYDRNGSTMLNFLGLGASMDLPLWDRKQGSIREAELGLMRADRAALQVEKNAETEREVAQANYDRALAYFAGFSLEQLAEQQEQRLLFHKHFQERNTSMLAYIDFAESSLRVSQQYLQSKKEVRVRQIELQHAFGL